MARQDLIARASIQIAADPHRVWQALVEPEEIRQYMFGTSVDTDWEEGGKIAWRGEWQGKAYEDRGMVLEVRPERRLSYTHFSPLTGLPDAPENYHTVTVELTEAEPGTRIAVWQDGNSTEEARAHSERNWQLMLEGLKRHVEEYPTTA